MKTDLTASDVNRYETRVTLINVIGLT